MDYEMLNNMKIQGLSNFLQRLKVTLVKTSQEVESQLKEELCLYIMQKSGNILRAHCTCMAGMGSTCNNIAAALFRTEAAVGLGLINPTCTEKTCEWLRNKKNVNPVKIKDIILNRQDTCNRGKTVKRLLTTPKKNYDRLVQPQRQQLDFQDFSDKLKEIVPGSVLYTAVPKRKEKLFVRETLSTSEIKSELPNIDDYLVSSRTCDEFFTNMKENFCSGVIAGAEMATRGQSDNSLWFSFRKDIVTASKSHEVMTKVKMVL